MCSNCSAFVLLLFTAEKSHKAKSTFCLRTGISFWIVACASVAVAALCVPHSQHFVELWVFVSGNRIYYTWLLSPLSCYPCVRTGSRDDQHLQADSAGYLLRPAFPESGELPVLRSTLSGNQFLLSLHDAKVQEKGIRSRRKSKRKCKKIK